MPERDAQAIREACTRFATGHYPRTPRQTLATLAAATPEDARPDFYGGGVVADFEAEMAALLGKPAAVFMPSGTMAQQIALRIWADRTGNPAFACHPTCHLELHEDWAYRTLHGLHAELVGNRYRLLTLADLQALRVPVGMLLLELPQRPIGGALPAWGELVALTHWAREQGIILHLDGARLWECRPFYAPHDYAAIAALFDTVYVSFYKILGGLTGAVLAGPEDVINEARVWMHRHGGRVVHLYPYVLSARQALAERLPRIEAYVARAQEVAAALRALDGVEITPDPPPTNMFQLFLRRDGDALREAALDIAEETGTWLLRGSALAPAQIPAYWMMEFVSGDATLDIPVAELAGLYADLLRRAGTP
ncbi:MAG: aminotransferase class I/II-fold pyridoxal phosphate-dependent enzyme [Anaerolineae bacterium]